MRLPCCVACPAVWPALLCGLPCCVACPAVWPALLCGLLSGLAG